MKVILSEEQIKKLFGGRALNEEEETTASTSSSTSASTSQNNTNTGATATGETKDNPLPPMSMDDPNYNPAKIIARSTDRIHSYLSAIGGAPYYRGRDDDKENGQEDPMPDGPMAYADQKRQEYNDSIGATPSGDYASVPAVQGITLKPISRHIKRRKKPIRYLVIHYTAGPTSKAGSASSLQKLFNGDRDASADFAVDDGTKVQLNPDPEKYYCWSVGDNGGTHNGDSISIEMCSNRRKNTEAWPNHNGWYFTDATLSNARSLAKELMAKYKIPLSNVVRHFDMTGKLCPGVVGWNTGILYTTSGQKTNQRNNDSEWQKFKASLA